MSRARPGIRRSKIRTPQLALRDLHDVMEAERIALSLTKATTPLGQKLANRLRAWFFMQVRSFCARNMKAGL